MKFLLDFLLQVSNEWKNLLTCEIFNFFFTTSYKWKKKTMWDFLLYLLQVIDEEISLLVCENFYFIFMHHWSQKGTPFVSLRQAFCGVCIHQRVS